MRAAEGLVLAALLAALLACGPARAQTAGADYPNYRAAQEALDRRDCAAARAHLDAFLQQHPRFSEPRHRSFYLAVLRVMDDCDGSVVIHGVGESEGGISPLPENPPGPDRTP